MGSSCSRSPGDIEKHLGINIADLPHIYYYMLVAGIRPNTRAIVEISGNIPEDQVEQLVNETREKYPNVVLINKKGNETIALI